MIYAMIGGGIIGVAVSVMLLFNGRITGISGIISGLLRPIPHDWIWRACFIVGLLSGGLTLQYLRPESFNLINPQMTLFDYIFAGLLVGFGTSLGSGCTSGHGVCGISRLSLRSIVATLTFIFFGILSVLLFKILRGGL